VTGCACIIEGDLLGSEGAVSGAERGDVIPNLKPNTVRIHIAFLYYKRLT
jgi:hypothetical protein